MGKPGKDLMAKREARLAWAFVLPALGAVVLIAIFPLAWTVWESLHLHDLRMPWRGRPFVGLSNYTEALTDGRFWAALGHTALFTVGTVTLEVLLGLSSGGKSLLGKPKLADKSPEVLAALQTLARSWSGDARAREVLQLAARAKDAELRAAAGGSA